jgi:hypothetical protein
MGSMLAFVVVYMALIREDNRSPARDGAAPAPVASAVTPRGRPFHGLLESATDGASLDELDGTEAYRALLGNMKRLSVAEVTSHAEPVAARRLLEAPADYRGRLVRATGTLVAPLAVSRLPKNDAGHESRWRGLLVDTGSGDMDTAYAFDAFEAPSRELSRQEAVVVEGVFLQTAEYDAQRGKKRVPFLQAKSLRPAEGERVATIGGPSGYFLVLAIVIAIVPLSVSLSMGILRRRHERALVSALEKVHERRGPLGSGLARPEDKSPPASTEPPSSSG